MFNILYNSKYINGNKEDINKIYNVQYNGLIDVGYWYNDTTIIDDKLLMNEISKKYDYIYLFLNDIENLYNINEDSYDVYNYTDKNINKNKIFYFVDNGHITGINIPVPTLSHFLVTTINESLLRDIHQGIYRLRLLGYCQYVTIIQNKSTKQL